MNPTDLVSSILGLSPHVLAGLGAVGVLAVSLQAVLLVVARFVPPASHAARVLAVITTDLGKVGEWAARAGAWTARRITKPSGPALVLFLAASLGAAGALSYACTPAQRAVLNVPIVSKADAIGIAVSHAVGWCEAHGADPQAIATARQALVERDPGLAITVVRKMLEASAAAGEPVPRELVATVELAEGLLAAKAIQEGMQAITYLKSKDAGAEQ